MPKKIRFTIEQEDQIAEDYASGLSLREAAEKNRVSKSAVQRIVEDRGLMRARNGVDPAPAVKKYRPGSIMSLGPQLRKQYEADPRVNVYTLAAQYGCSITAIHRSLVAAGTEMRQAGGDRKSRYTYGLLGWIHS